MVNFKIPEEEKWVRQVMLAHADDINEFIRDASNQPNRYRAFGIMGATSGEVLLTYEENLNAKEDIR